MDLMMTETKRKRISKAIPPTKGNDPAVGYIIDSDDPAEVERCLAEKLPEWSGLSRLRKAELVRHSMSSRSRPTRACIAVKKEPGSDNTTIAPPESEQASYALTIFETFATGSSEIVQARLTEIFRHFSDKKSDSAVNINSALAFVGGCSPENEHQSAMATQMALVHDAALHALRRAGSSETMEGFEKYTTAANKLSRTFAVLTDSYAKLQRGGIQTVKHVNVYEGGQAVVAEHVHTGGVNVRSPNQAHTTGNIGGSAAMLGHDPQGNGVSIASGPRQKAMPDAWIGER